jgi:hypothetical protein
MNIMRMMASVADLGGACLGGDCELLDVQAAWRGYKVRAASGRAGRETRRRLAAAHAAAAAAPHKRIGVRAREALTVLLGSKQCSQVGMHRQYSGACCASKH